jgi:hypothetical protein
MAEKIRADLNLYRNNWVKIDSSALGSRYMSPLLFRERQQIIENLKKTLRAHRTPVLTLGFLGA